MIKAFGVSQSGPVRQINEDRSLIDDELGLYVVADGMGGHAAGEVASSLAVEAIRNFIARSTDSNDLSWPCGIDPTLSFAGNRLRTAIYLANRRVFRESESHNDFMGMGTTVVCALIVDARLIVGHVGDSRLYLLTKEDFSSETRDDTWAQSILGGVNTDTGPDATRGHPMQHILVNVLGVRENVDIHIKQLELIGGERLLLCSDGVHNVLDVPALRELLSADGDPQAQAESVVAAALERKTRDNVTALIVHYDGTEADRG